MMSLGPDEASRAGEKAQICAGKHHTQGGEVGGDVGEEADGGRGVPAATTGGPAAATDGGKGN